MSRKFIESKKFEWMRVIIGDYLKARELFCAYAKDSKESFDRIKEIEELLYRVKEKYKHIFKKPAETGELEISKVKLNPNIDEFRFGRNIGMLFHRARVARELTYTLQSCQKNVLNTFFKKGTKEYEEIEEEILITHKELDEDIELMNNWFKKGLEKDNWSMYLYIICKYNYSFWNYCRRYL